MGWIGAAVAVVGSYAKSQQDKQAGNKSVKDQLKMTSAEAQLQRENSQFDAEQNYYYQQLNRQSKQRGLAQYRQFSQMKQIDPNYRDTSTGIVLPNQPVWNQGKYALPVVPAKAKKHISWKDRLLKPSLNPMDTPLGGMVGG